LFLLNRETQLEFFFETVFGKSKCDCWCSHFLQDCCFHECCVSLILITISLPEKLPLFEELLSPIGRMQLGLAASFVTPSPKKMMETTTAAWQNGGGGSSMAARQRWRQHSGGAGGSSGAQWQHGSMTVAT
jgi:hypothetical protein